MVKKEELRFNAKQHRYFIGDEELLSVTKWVNSFFPEFDTKKVSFLSARKKTREGTPTTAAEVREQWKDTRDYGTLVHKEIEEWLVSRNEPKTPEAKHAITYLQSLPSGARIHTEAKIGNTQLGLAGTIDLMLEWESPIIKPHVILIDWKTSASIDRLNSYDTPKDDSPIAHLQLSKYNKYTLQLSTYMFMLEATGQKLPLNLFIVQLSPEGIIEHRVDYLRNTVGAMLKANNPRTMIGGETNELK